MIRDYERGSGFQGALRSLIGERVVGALCSPNNTLILLFESGCAFSLRAWDYGGLSLEPMSVEDALASVKEQMREADLHQANLAGALKHLGDAKCANRPKTCYVGTGDVTTGA